MKKFACNNVGVVLLLCYPLMLGLRPTQERKYMTSNEKKKQIAEIRRMICTMFEEYANDSVVVITDKINIALVNIYGLTLDYLDRCKQLRETYQTLTYHHSIYRKGQSRKEWFINICEDCKKGDY